MYEKIVNGFDGHGLLPEDVTPDVSASVVDVAREPRREKTRSSSPLSARPALCTGGTAIA
ncbi:hypothetical protein QYH69_16635 [Paraburkholderia sp. SARCC-3016]|uniref:hypothetical protein n=1 Tax=Paraburkholderia sp. SARCC-3016 TaxID=3058611 RepID=UPI0028087804|nr:hypothetical protein [Paraburkholderia sp. SARCC-3016]MDQ7978876.1 hypothetical protein [Paraburkholderia sp. SARCC-3016]